MPLNFNYQVIATWVIVFVWAKEPIKDFCSNLYSNLSTRKKFNIDIDGRLSNWIYQGYLVIQNLHGKNQLIITQSNSGCLLDGSLIKKYRWKNLNAKFEIMFPGGTFEGVPISHALGIIFRAQDLENYIMVQIGAKENLNDSQFSFSPHLRFNGNYAIVKEVFGDFHIKDKKPNEFFRIEIDVIKDSVTVKVDENELATWQIPTHTEAHIIQHPQGAEEKKPFGNVPRLTFRRSTGKFGFRCYFNEKAIIKNLKIEGSNS